MAGFFYALAFCVITAPRTAAVQTAPFRRKQTFLNALNSRLFFYKYNFYLIKTMI